MKTFSLHLQAEDHAEELSGLVSFVGEDASGSFGILPGHARMMTFLNFGLAHFCLASGKTEFLALPGALLYFVRGELFIHTRDFVRSSDERDILEVLDKKFRAEETKLSTLRESLKQFEQEVFRRLWKIGEFGEELF